ncbi:hypothetical protein PUN28_001494 [Cardiocondyla obscurior]|uniref:Ribosomal protein S14 n=1 Tax=Cardiocondyla obscurior TaxID=286306 RepID=A0AAW2H5S9_9HYME
MEREKEDREFRDRKKDLYRRKRFPRLISMRRHTSCSCNPECTHSENILYEPVNNQSLNLRLTVKTSKTKNLHYNFYINYYCTKNFLLSLNISPPIHCNRWFKFIGRTSFCLW